MTRREIERTEVYRSSIGAVLQLVALREKVAHMEQQVLCGCEGGVAMWLRMGRDFWKGLC